MIGRQRTLAPRLALGAASILMLADVARAQVVRGSVRDQAGSPVIGVVVTLVDSAGVTLVRTLSAAEGAFSIRAAQPGTYRLRAMRIGFQPVMTPPFALAAGESREERVVFDGAPVTIAPVRVVERGVCGRRAADDPRAVFAAWDQAMTAVTAAAITSAASGITATTMQIERTLDPSGRRVRSLSATVSTDRVTQPWRSLPPAALRAYGYSQVDDQGVTTYHAPGLDVLTSTAFLEDHCVRLVRARDTSEVGIAFEPNATRRLEAELEGTLWLHRGSARLRRMEFTYVNVPGAPLDAGDRAGGTLAFDRLADGSWAITEWEIRMPQFERADERATEVRVGEIRGTGGALLLATRGVETLYRRPPLTVAGVVLDSTTGRPVPAARVEFVGTAVQGIAGADGRFALTDLLPGEYEVAVRTASLDSVRAVSRSSLLVTEGMAPVTLRVPTATELGTALCGRALLGAEGRGRGAVIGVVTDGAGATVGAGMPVMVEWTETALAPGNASRVTSTRRGLQTRTDSSGAFRICGAPMETALRVTALPDSGRAATEELRLAPDARFAQAELRVDRARGAVAAFVGIVEGDSARGALADVEVLLPELSLSASTDSTGRFRIAEVPAGRHRVVVRRLGFGVFDGEVEFAPHEELERRIVLSSVASLSQVDIIATPLDNALLEFEENRRVGLGRFLTREQLTRFDALPLPNALSRLPSLTVALGSGGQRQPATTRNRIRLQAVMSGRCEPPYLMNRAGQCACFARVYIDGVLQNPGYPTEPFDVNQILTEGVESVEWYPSPAGIPARYLDLNTICGVMVIHTRRDPPEKPEKPARRPPP